MISKADHAGPRNICFVVTDLPRGEWQSQEINAFLGIAQHFASRGDVVTLLWTPWPHELRELGDAGLAAIKEVYFERYLIYLEVVPESDELIPTWASRDRQSIVAFHFLRKGGFDNIFFMLEQGIGYFPIVAKETGQAFADCELTVVAQSPLMWRSHVDKFFVGWLNDLTVAHMERHCAENCDQLIVSSDHVRDWMAEKKWTLPANTHVIPPLRPQAWRNLTKVRRPSRTRSPIRELVLPCTNDYRDGLVLACDALDKLAEDHIDDLTISIVGVFGKILGEHTGGMVLRRARNWPFALNLLGRMPPEEILEYVVNRDCAVLLPAYSASTSLWAAFCVEEGIPLAATTAGSLPEYFGPEQTGRPRSKNANVSGLAASEPAALADAITRTLTRKAILPDRADYSDKIRQQWSELVPLHRHATPSSRKRPAKNKLVSIVLVHHDRPDVLPQAVEAVKRQDYDNIELILVDDGSKRPDSLQLLKSMEADFKARKWKIIYGKNEYLGAARNRGVRASKGEYILFADDDNALFHSAVSQYVRGLENSNADICTSFQRIFYEKQIPSNESIGYIQYFTLGGSLELGLMHNSFGDANAIMRRDVFSRIGYIKELKSGGGEDWEFFARAIMKGLKLRVIPEPLYWYRSSTSGMFRKSNWYDTRKLILNTYKEASLDQLELCYHLILAQNVGEWEREALKDNLNFRKSDEIYMKLSELDPNSDQAMEILAKAAAAEGRAATALGVIGRTSAPDYLKRSSEILVEHRAWEDAGQEVSIGFVRQNDLESSRYHQFRMWQNPTREATADLYVEDVNRLYVVSKQAAPVIVVLAGGCPTGTSAFSVNVSLDEAVTDGVEFFLALTEPGEDPVAAVAKGEHGLSSGTSGWLALRLPGEGAKLTASLEQPATRARNVVLAMRARHNKKNVSTGCFSAMKIITAVPPEELRRPRTKAPSGLLRSRLMTRDEANSAKLVTSYPSMFPLLLLDPDRGLYVRPNPGGPVVASMTSIVPPRASKVLAKVMIDHEDAGPFEFAMALHVPERVPVWDDSGPDQCLGFSGWVKVADHFRPHDVVVRTSQVFRTPITLQLAIRLPPGVPSDPASSFWKEIFFIWDE